MTCIVGYVDKHGCVYLGGDSAASDDSDVDIRKEPKVFKNGSMIFGYSGSFRMGQLLQYTLKVPKQKPKKEVIYKYLCTTFVNAVRDCFHKNGYVPSKNENWAFLIGYRGKLYQIYDDFHVADINTPYDSCGGGKAYALGAMHILHKCNLQPQTKVRRALKAAAAHVMSVRPPFKIVSLSEY